MISRTPRRSGKTQLTDDELIILDALFDGPRPLGTLYRENFGEIHNLSYRHDLSGDGLNETVRKLESQGLLHPEEGHSRGAYFRLTDEGGRLWEAERAPDWANFVAVDGEADSMGNRTMLIAQSQSLGVAQAYLVALEACGHTPVLLETRTSSLIPHARLLPWKSLDQIHEVRASVGPAEYGGSKIDWEQYRQNRIWWTTVSELHDFPPRIVIRLRAGAGDLDLTAEVHAIEDRLDRVEEVDLRGTTAACDSEFEGTLVTDHGQLWLDHTSVGDSGLAHLAGLRRMRTLFLHSTKVTDAGLRFLCGMRDLYSLHVNDTVVTDAGLEHLRGFHLSHVGLSGTRVTPAGIERLRNAMPGVELD